MTQSKVESCCGNMDRYAKVRYNPKNGRYHIFLVVVGGEEIETTASSLTYDGAVNEATEFVRWLTSYGPIW